MTDQRIAFVTGASRGIGRGIAERLAADGRHVVLASRSEGPLNDLKASIEAAGGTASVCAVDVGDGAALADAIEQTTKDLGSLGILVNNAGITRDNLVLRMSDEEFDEVIRVNLRSAFIACRAAARPMMKGPVRSDRERREHERAGRQRGPGELRREQGGPGRPDQDDRP